MRFYIAIACKSNLFDNGLVKQKVKLFITLEIQSYSVSLFTAVPLK